MRKDLYKLGFELLDLKINAVLYLLTGFIITTAGISIENIIAKWIMGIGGLLIIIISYIVYKLEGNRILKEARR